MNQEYEQLLYVDDSSVEQFHVKFKAKKQAEIILSKTEPGKAYKIIDGDGRYVIVEVASFARDYKGQASWWCNILQAGWVS